MKKKNHYKVSVLVLTYNPIWEKLVATLKSIITQKNVSIQLVISDDGSKENYFEKMEEYLRKNEFDNYIMIANIQNEGTVLNMLHGLEVTTGEFIKTISPGDCLTDDYVLFTWIEDMVKKNVKWSFSDAIYYESKEDKFYIVQKNAHPANVRPYVKGKKEECRWNYVVFGDIALGAAIIAQRQIVVEYLRRIVGKVKYAEDNIWRLMMFDGINGGYYPYPAILYEVGAGVSTCGNEIWSKRLKQDWNETTKEMISTYKRNDKFQRDAVYAIKKLNSKNKLIRFLIKGKIRMILYTRFFRRKTPLKQSADCTIEKWFYKRRV